MLRSKSRSGEVSRSFFHHRPRWNQELCTKEINFGSYTNLDRAHVSCVDQSHFIRTLVEPFHVNPKLYVVAPLYIKPLASPSLLRIATSSRYWLHENLKGFIYETTALLVLSTDLERPRTLGDILMRKARVNCLRVFSRNYSKQLSISLCTNRTPAKSQVYIARMKLYNIDMQRCEMAIMTCLKLAIAPC